MMMKSPKTKLITMIPNVYCTYILKERVSLQRYRLGTLWIPIIKTVLSYHYMVVWQSNWNPCWHKQIFILFSRSWYASKRNKSTQLNCQVNKVCSLSMYDTVDDKYIVPVSFRIRSKHLVWFCYMSKFNSILGTYTMPLNLLFVHGQMLYIVFTLGCKCGVIPLLEIYGFWTGEYKHIPNCQNHTYTYNSIRRSWHSCRLITWSIVFSFIPSNIFDHLWENIHCYTHINAMLTMEDRLFLNDHLIKVVLIQISEW